MAEGNPQPTDPNRWAGPTGQGVPPPPPAPQPPSGQSPWWAQNAANDPWRNPSTPAVVRHTPTPALPPTEPPLPPSQPAGVGISLVVVISLATSLLAGVLGAALMVYAASGGGSTANFTSPNTERPAGSYQEIIAQVLPSVVTIWVDNGSGKGGQGSGFVFSPEGYIVTNQHVAAMAEGDARISVQFSDGTEIPGEVVGGANSTDIAVIKVDQGDLPALAIADSNSLVVGDPVVAIGAPLGLSHSVTEGIISALDRPVVAGESERDSTVTAAIQTDAAINPGNSGGPLVDAGGALVGVNTSIYTVANDDGEGGSIGLGFAIPSNQVTRIATEIIETGSANRTVLGVTMEPSKPGQLGVTLDTIENGGPADEAGLDTGDVVTSFNGHRITADVQLQALVLKYAGGDTVTIGYERDGQQQEIQVTLASVPDE
ncbi:putative serine protease PepD [Stackebrandtia endophytica]|uniref:Putative serine protease PepD n=1 Tax=Stackebrandtia endophytica TaxID=1496996 RepID=A0A543AU96_9ACTN|nr:trypsin-like peptidase domain-containing protein [Stackebrandtia endophytica]TQL76130.1 putative serine protease PepD [Stackebrandtia endophytica]